MITDLPLSELRRRLDAGELTSVEIISAYRSAYLSDSRSERPLNGYIELFADALERADEADRERARVRSAGRFGGGHAPGGASGSSEALEHAGRRSESATRPLLGLPLAVKDNILIRGRQATCASSVLRGFVAPYSATVVERLVEAGMIPIGRTNMDEFAMGSSCEYSCYGPARNPVDRARTPGGSSGGSAAVVAGGQAPVALGSETGGSVRLPASFCGVYGLKPSYGALSRYGLVAFGSSLDQIGIVGRAPRDLALVVGHAAGLDANDSTSAVTDFAALRDGLAASEVRGLRVAVPDQFLGEGLDAEVRAALDRFIGWLRNRGAAVETVSLPILDATIAIYYIIAPAEASSNLARYDGVRYGLRVSDGANLFELYERTRSAGFGIEVKRRILLGNYVLSSGYYDEYYKKAQAVRTLLIRELGALLGRFDLILSPTAPSPAFELGAKVGDPLAMYLTDIYTTFANLALLPALSIPAGTTRAGLPVGIQIAGARFSEPLLLGCAQAWHEEAKQ